MGNWTSLYFMFNIWNHQICTLQNRYFSWFRNNRIGEKYSLLYCKYTVNSSATECHTSGPQRPHREHSVSFVSCSWGSLQVHSCNLLLHLSAASPLLSHTYAHILSHPNPPSLFFLLALNWPSGTAEIHTHRESWLSSGSRSLLFVTFSSSSDKIWCNKEWFIEREKKCTL